MSGSHILLLFWCPQMVAWLYYYLRLKNLSWKSCAPGVIPKCTRSSSSGWTRALSPDPATGTADSPQAVPGVGRAGQVLQPGSNHHPELLPAEHFSSLSPEPSRSMQLPHTYCWLRKLTWFTSTDATYSQGLRRKLPYSNWTEAPFKQLRHTDTQHWLCLPTLPQSLHPVITHTDLAWPDSRHLVRQSLLHSNASCPNSPVGVAQTRYDTSSFPTISWHREINHRSINQHLPLWTDHNLTILTAAKAKGWSQSQRVFQKT